MLCVGNRAIPKSENIDVASMQAPSHYAWNKARDFIIFALLILSPLLVSGRVDGSRDRLRLNHGVNFKFVAEYTPVIKEWIHSYMVHIPQDVLSIHDDIIMGDKREDKRSSWLDVCLLRVTNEMNNRADLNVGPLANPDVSRAGSLCVKFSPMIMQVIKTIKDDHRLLRQQLRAISDLLPPALEPPTLNSTRGSRAILGFLGDLGSSLFGIATNKQVNQIEGSVKQLAANYKTQSINFKKSMADLSSFSKLTNERFDNLIRGINGSALNSMGVLHQLAEDINNRHDFGYDLLTKAIQTNAAMLKLSVFQSEFVNSVQTLVGGRLPAFLISSDMLNATIREITQSLRGHAFYLIHDNPTFYYKTARVSFAVLHGHLVINVPFDLSATYYYSQCYRVQTFAQPIPGQKNAKLVLSGVLPGFVMQHGGMLFSEISETELLEIKLGISAPLEGRVLKKVPKSTSCALALFNDAAPLIKQFCRYIIVLDDLQPGVTHLEAGNFVLTGYISYLVGCGERDTGKRLECETQCFVKLDDGCYLRTENEWILAAYGNGTGVIQDYSVTKPLLAELFDDTDLEAIKGNTFFRSLPDISIPEIKIYRATSRDFISEDNIISINMKKAVQQVKESNLIVHSMADSIVLGNQELNLPDAWTTPVGWGVIASLIVIALLLVQVGYLSLRLRVVALSLAVIQNGLKAQAQAPDDATEPARLRLAFSPPPTPGLPIDQKPQDIHVKIVQSLSSFWFYVLIAGVGLALLVILGRHLFRRYFREIRNIEVKSWLAFHFSVPHADGRNLIIKIQKINALASDIYLVSDQPITDFELQGCWSKKLLFNWPAEVVDQFSGTKFLVKQSVSLKAYQAYMAVRLLNARFVCKPIFIEGKRVVKAKIRNGAISRPATPMATPRKVFQSLPTAPEVCAEEIEMCDFV